MTLLPLASGSWQLRLEGEATDILIAERGRGSNAISARQDWFTEEQWTLRRNREVYSSQPIEPLVESGLYRRAYNPLIRERPTSRGRLSRRQDPWLQDTYEYTDFGPGVLLPSYSRQERIVEGGGHYTWDIMMPNRVTVPLADVEVFQVVWECPDCAYENYVGPDSSSPGACKYCKVVVEWVL